MPETRDGLTSRDVGSGNEPGPLLVADPRIIDHLVALGEEGMASGIDETFDIDAFIKS